VSKHHGVAASRGLQEELWCDMPGELRRSMQTLGGPAGQADQRFARLFPNLKPLKATDKQLIDLSELMRERRPAAGKAIPAGFTFLGQFIDHDVTLDLTSSLEQQIDPAAVISVRTPVLELDSVYGRGPDDQPYMYDQKSHGKFLIGNACARPTNKLDFPRNHQGRALIGDHRNDENTIVAQLHLAFLRFHNAVLHLVEKGKTGCERCYDDDFEEAQRLVRWHYQWIVLHEFFDLTIDKAVLASLRADGRRFYLPQGKPFIPVEFAVAAYRFGHSQVRSRYDVNKLRLNVDLFQPPPTGLTSFSPIPPANRVDWSYFFKTSATRDPQIGRPIDTRLALELFDLPFIPAGQPSSLAARNLLRGRTFSLPAGETVACAMGVKPLPLAPAVKRVRLDATPLWFYVLWEANKHPERKLGKVGGRLVAEVLLGMAEEDCKSYLSVDPCWRPCLPRARKGDFRMADLIKLAS